MLRSSMAFLALIFSTLGLAFAFAAEASTWRLAISASAGAMGGAGIDAALQCIQYLHRKANC